MYQIIKFLLQSYKDETMIYYLRLSGRTRIWLRHTVNRQQIWDLNQGIVSLECLFFSLFPILVLSCYDVQMVQKSEWYKIVLIHQLWLNHILSSLSLVFSLWRYMEIKIQGHCLYLTLFWHCSLPFFLLNWATDLGNLSVSYIENFCILSSPPLFHFPFTVYSTVWLPIVYLVRNLGRFLTFVFRTNITVNYLVHISFLCLQVYLSNKFPEVGKLFPNCPS